jgi:AAA domain
VNAAESRNSIAPQLVRRTEDERAFGVRDVQDHISTRPRWAIPNLAPRGQLTLLYGAAGSGKSTLYQEALAANSLGRPFVEFLPFEEGQRFLVYDWENGKDMFFRTLQRLGITSAAHGKDNFAYHFETPGVGLATATGREAVRRAAELYNATCIVFDALLDAFRGVPPTDEDAIAEAMQGTKAIAVQLDVAVLVVAHSPKAAYEDGLNMLKGNAAWGQKADQMFRLHQERKSEFRRLEHTKARAMSKRHALTVRLVEEGDPDVGPVHVVGTTATTAEAVRTAKRDAVDDTVRAYLVAHGPVRRTDMTMALGARGVGSTALNNALKRLGEAGLLNRPQGERGPYLLAPAPAPAGSGTF